MAIVIVAAVTSVFMGICLLLNHEVLRLLIVHAPRLNCNPRTRIGVVFAALILIHLVEIRIFSGPRFFQLA